MPDFEALVRQQQKQSRNPVERLKIVSPVENNNTPNNGIQFLSQLSIALIGAITINIMLEVLNKQDIFHLDIFIDRILNIF